MNEKKLIQSVIKEKMPDFEVVYRNCIQMTGQKRGLPIYRIAFATVAACLLVFFGLHFAGEFLMPAREMQTEPQEIARKGTERTEMAIEAVPERGDASSEMKKNKERGALESKEEIMEDSKIALEKMANPIVRNEMPDLKSQSLEWQTVQRSKGEAKEWEADFYSRLNLPADMSLHSLTEIYLPDNFEKGRIYGYQIRFEAGISETSSLKIVELIYLKEASRLHKSLKGKKDTDFTYIDQTAVLVFSDSSISTDLAVFQWKEWFFEVRCQNLTDNELIALLQSICQ